MSKQTFMPSGITVIPNEILASILAHITYSRKQHANLHLVNKRFHEIIGSPAFRLEVAKTQYPEQTTLQGPKSLTRKQLDDLEVYELQLSCAVRSYGNFRAESSHTYYGRQGRGQTRTANQLLENGLRLLDYIVSVYQGKEHWRLPVLLGHGVLDPGHCLLLRVTIGRLYDYVFATTGHIVSHHSDHVNNLRNCGIPGIRVPIDKIVVLARRRTFERAVLCLDWSSMPGPMCRPSFALLGNLVREVVIEAYATECEKLVSSLICATPLGDLLIVMDPTARDEKLLKAVEWRILSRDIDLSDPAFADTRADTGTDQLLMAEFMHERMCNVLDEDADHDGHQSDSVSKVDWSEVGEIIRKVAEEVSSSSV